MSSMPFWQTTTLAPEATILSTIPLRLTSSCLRKASIWAGLSMLIFASSSGFSFSRIRRVMRFLLFRCVWACLCGRFLCRGRCRGLSLYQPRDKPVFFSTFTSSTSAFMPSLFFCNCKHSFNRYIGEVFFVFRDDFAAHGGDCDFFEVVFLALKSTVIAILSKIFRAFSDANLYPSMIIVG